MRTRNIKTVGVLLMSMFMVTAINAQSPRQGGRGLGPDGDRPYGKMDRLAALELSEEQQAEITTLRTEHYKTITPLKNKMVELKARERTLLSEESIDMKAVNKTIDEQSELSNSMRKLQVKHQVAIKGLLSDEQVMKLQQRRQYAQRSSFHNKGSRRGMAGQGSHGGAGSDRGYRGYRGI